MEVPSAPSVLLILSDSDCDSATAAEQGSCSPQPWTAALTPEEGPGDGHTVLLGGFWPLPALHCAPQQS